MGAVRITCWKCGLGYDVADGADLRGVTCPTCKNPPTNTFLKLENAHYDRACGHARKGEKDAALEALEAALQSGVDLELVDSDPALGKLRGDARYAALLKRYRPT